MNLSPAAFNWLLRIDAEGGLRVDSGNGCIRNLREALLIKYAHRANGDDWRYATVTEFGKQIIAKHVEKTQASTPL